MRPEIKAALLRGVSVDGEAPYSIHVTAQEEQLKNPDARVLLAPTKDADILARYTQSFQGTTTGDNPRFVRLFWETNWINGAWRTLQSTGDEPEHFAGRHHVFLWEDGNGCVCFVSSGTSSRAGGVE